MVRVGLTGGIASGKTAVSDLLAAHGARVIDADVLAREVVAPGTDGLAAIVDRFGAGVLTASGELDRPALGAIVFADASARSDLEAIIHPRVRDRAAALTVDAESDGVTVVVQVIPLLVETGQQRAFDCVVVVDVDPGVQHDRLVARSGLTAEQADQRVAAQADRADRVAAATWLIDNTGSRDDLVGQVDELWRHLTRHDGSHHQPRG